MATEYTLSYTAEEINEKLKKVGDPTSWNDLTDKPFGDEETITIKMLTESEATEYTHPSFGQVWEILKTPQQLEIGETYTIVYNGVSYSCVCQSAPAGFSDDPNALAMGNFVVAGGENTGEPFAMLISYLYQRIGIIDLSNANSVLVSIHQNKTRIKTIEGEYLPDGVPYVEEGEMVEVLPEYIITEDNAEADMASIPALGLVAGNAYFVKLQSVEYTCIAWTVTHPDFGVVIGLGDVYTATSG